MVKAIFIDFDGLLVNTEELFLKANQEYFSPFGFVFTVEHHKAGMGKRFTDWIPTILPKDFPKSGKEIFEERNKLLERFIEKEIRLEPGVRSFLTMASANFISVLVSTSSKSHIQPLLDRFGLERFFFMKIFGEDVHKAKPDPECYVLAAKRNMVQPNECLVVEDSPNGVQAGLSAGMHVFAVPNAFCQNHPIFQSVDGVFSLLSVITVQNIQSL